MISMDKNLSEARKAIRTLQKEVEYLRTALSPFACLSHSELSAGDVNRARRTMRRVGWRNTRREGEDQPMNTELGAAAWEAKANRTTNHKRPRTRLTRILGSQLTRNLRRGRG